MSKKKKHLPPESKRDYTDTQGGSNIVLHRGNNWVQIEGLCKWMSGLHATLRVSWLLTLACLPSLRYNQSAIRWTTPLSFGFASLYFKITLLIRLLMYIFFLHFVRWQNVAGTLVCEDSVVAVLLFYSTSCYCHKVKCIDYFLWVAFLWSFHQIQVINLKTNYLWTCMHNIYSSSRSWPLCNIPDLLGFIPYRLVLNVLIFAVKRE